MPTFNNGEGLDSVRTKINAAIDKVDGTTPITSVDINSGTIDGVTIGGADAGAITGTTITGSSFVSTGNMTFGDNDKAIFGADSDLQIFHNGTHSYIRDLGTGNLRITAENFTVRNSADNAALITAIDGGSTYLFDNGSQKLATTATGVDITGVLSSDGLTVDNNSSTPVIINRNQAVDGYGIVLNQADTTDGNSLEINYQTTTTGTVSSNELLAGINFEAQTHDFSTRKGNVRIKTTEGGIGYKDRVLVAYNGDVSFYEDTGTTPKFFWDASAERLVIGDNTVSPSADAGDLVVGGSTGNNGITIGAATTGTGSLRFADSGGTGRGIVLYDHSTDYMAFHSAGSERMRITSSGAVGIGTTTPYAGDGLTVSAGASAHLVIRAGTTAGEARLWFGDSDSDIQGRIEYQNTDDSMLFWTASSEAMRIDSSGNIGIGENNPITRLDVRDSIADTTSSKASNSILSIANEDSTATAATMFTLRSNQGDSTRERAILEAGLEGTSGGYLGFWTRPSGAAISEKMRIDADGNVGIGTDSPATALDVVGTITSDGLTVDGNPVINGTSPQLFFQTSNASHYNWQIAAQENVAGAFEISSGNADATAANDTYTKRLVVLNNGDISFYEDTGTTAKFFWNASAERLGIGTTSPIVPLHITTAGLTGALFESTSTSGSYIRFKDADTSQHLWIGSDGNNLNFYRDDSNLSMRIDSSGNLLVATTNASLGSGGIQLNASGRIGAAASSLSPMVLNRKTLDGTIIDLRKDGVPLGSIGIESDKVYIGTGDTGLRFVNTSNQIRPFNTSTLADRDDGFSLGSDGARFTDLYLSGGVYLGGTTSANLLDDYEEGTFTPVVADASSGGNVAAGGNFTGLYTKVGNVVTVTVSCFNVDTTGMTGANDFYIRGFPFTSKASVGGVVYTGAVALANVTTDGDNIAYLLEDETVVRIAEHRSGTTADFIVVSEVTSGTADIRFSMTYPVN